MPEKQIPKIKAQSEQLSDSDTPDKEVNPRLCTSEEEKTIWDDKRIHTSYIGSLSHSRAQTNPTVERGPPWRPRIKKLPKDKAAEKCTQTKDKEKQT